MARWYGMAQGPPGDLFEARADLLMFQVWPRCQRARQALRRAGFRGERLATPGPGESWSVEVAAEFAACLLNEIDDVVRAHIQNVTKQDQPKKGGAP